VAIGPLVQWLLPLAIVELPEQPAAERPAAPGLAGQVAAECAA
jgi:hypothetical protein